MTSSYNYELPPYQGGEYLAPNTSPRAVSPLSSAPNHGLAHSVPNHDVSTETLLNNRATPTKEQTNVQCNAFQPKRSKRLLFRDWYWEFAAATFSLACVVTVIVILRFYQGKSLSTWHFFHDITLNTVVALLSTLSRTALIVPVASCISQLKWIHLVSSPRSLHEFQVLDEASRGPWGSMTLIWRLHFKAKLATWGALITIVSLAMGPLSQQLLSYPSRLHLEETGATFYRNQIYDSGAGWGLTGASCMTFMIQIRSYLLTSCLDRVMDPTMQGAILNGLYNLSAPVQVQCQTGNCQWDDFTTLAVSSECKNVTSSTKIECGVIAKGRLCNYTTPSGFFIKSSTRFSSGGGSATQFNSTARPPQTSSQLGSVVNSTLLDFAAARMTGPYSDEAPDITECGLRWVARHVQNTTVVNGTFHPGIFTDHELSGVTNPFDERRWVTFNVSNESAAFPGNRSFSVGPVDNARVAEFLSTVFSSSLSDTFGLALNASNLTRAMERISDSMTYTLGQSPSGIELPGQTITPEQYVHVNWEWIVLPIVEVAMGIAFLAATLLQSWRKDVVAWKSSAIIPLLTEMEGWRTGEVRTGSAWEVEKRVKGMMGLLESKENGGQIFRRVQ